VTANYFTIQSMSDRRRLQRVFDVVGATAGMAFFAPAMAVIALAILAADGAPVLFRQERIGYRRRSFWILKFRTMRDGTVTRTGRLLRATGLDELPQFVNILRGDMSAVGPRPLTGDDIARLGWNTEARDFRFACRPGLTGLAQLAGARADEGALVLDQVHASRWSARLDCELIAWSFAVNAFGKKRVREWLRRRFPESYRPNSFTRAAPN
jgi:undecaprenyl phosphate N,N'-diacetylbacillosamine 1-phosphate transferase